MAALHQLCRVRSWARRAREGEDEAPLSWKYGAGFGVDVAGVVGAAVVLVLLLMMTVVAMGMGTRDGDSRRRQCQFLITKKTKKIETKKTTIPRVTKL